MGSRWVCDALENRDSECEAASRRAESDNAGFKLEAMWDAGCRMRV